ncbi:hypothetical protein TELCIR_02634 [Teladorsagia circumcincta]|uniref:Sphingomyelin synthase-like domain-containing protein n=1 Tax=Teladorsagia circumcincta TaxID=45464 RepID=A0A2G9UYK7_TELCI|nr:hypothetical protein TELCIR_02634 [Teladorsagia circumcincta]
MESTHDPLMIDKEKREILPTLITKSYVTRRLPTLFAVAFVQLRPRELCGDLIVSGHTLTIFTSFYTFKYYAPKKLKPLSYMLNMLAVMAVLAILFARKHYTIDVLLGVALECGIAYVMTRQEPAHVYGSTLIRLDKPGNNRLTSDGWKTQ